MPAAGGRRNPAWRPGPGRGYLSRMSASRLRALRYLRSWISARDDVRAREVTLLREGTPVPATFLTPGHAPHPLPAWIVLHGITRPGRRHPQLVRFTRALAETGCAVLVPEVPEWREMELAPHLTAPTVLAAADALAGLCGSALRGPPALMGFSFGSPQALVASVDPRLQGRLAGVAGFGGYCGLERTLVFQFTGRHAYAGEEHRLRPDPYGRWIAGANYLTSVPGYGGADPVAAALRSLAARAGDEGVVAWDPRYDPAKEEARRRLTPGHRELFDLFAPPSAVDPDPVAGEEMAHALAAAARRTDPLVEPGPALDRVRGPVHLLHGRQDRLIPFTEMLRLRDALPPASLAASTVTRLFAHSSSDRLPGPAEAVREAAAFLRALAGFLSLV